MEFHFAPETLLGEVRIRSVRILIGLGLTWFTRYWFPEECISLLAKPFLTLPLPLDSYFVRTQSTEASPTYVATSPIACSYFVFPLISHQIWCFSIPSCYVEQRTKYNRFLHLSGSRFSLFLFLTPPRVVPHVWHFPYFVGATSTNSLMIKLQPKIYDHIMLTVRISFIPSVCSQVPHIVIRLLEPRGLSVETSTSNRRFLMVFPLLTAALSTPPDIWCQIVARFLISLIIELAISVALYKFVSWAGRVEWGDQSILIGTDPNYSDKLIRKGQPEPRPMFILGERGETEMWLHTYPVPEYMCKHSKGLAFLI